MKIGIFRALYLGDILCSIPAIRKIKEAYPHALIYYIGLPTLRELVMRFSYIDYYISFPGYKGLPEQEVNPYEIEVFIEECKEEKFDVLIQMHGNGTIVNKFLKKLKAKRLVGFCPDSKSMTQDMLPYPNNIHEIYRHLQLIELLNISYTENDKELEYPIFDGECDDFEHLRTIYNLDKYVVIHVGAKSEARRWDLNRFAALAKYFIQKNLAVICTGTWKEYSLVKEFVQMVGEGCVNLAGLTDYGTIGCVIHHAKLLVSNCTGVSHVAAALKTKSLVISLDGEPNRWGPLNKELHITVDGLQDIQPNTLFPLIDSLIYKKLI